MTDADQMSKLLEAAKSVLEEDIIPSLPSRKRINALMVSKALSIALHARCQMVRQGKNDTDQKNKVLSDQIRSGVYDTSLNGEITDRLAKDVEERLEASNPDFKMHEKFSQHVAN